MSSYKPLLTISVLVFCYNLNPGCYFSNLAVYSKDMMYYLREFLSTTPQWLSVQSMTVILHMIANNRNSR